MGEGSWARVICDSIYDGGPRLVTVEGRFHRFVLSEANTHRVFSRNSASSRAIPLAKQLERVREDPALPVVWASEQKGMSGGDEIEDTDLAESRWLQARNSAVEAAGLLGHLSVHKSIANRLLEPFMWHTVIITSTAWDNFLGLRCNPMAQPEIRVFAEAVKEALDASTPQVLKERQWHLPYIQDDERDDMPLDTQIKVSAARCARVSYLTQNGVRDFEQDVQLYERLTSANPMHASPLEHVATPAPWNSHEVRVDSMTGPYSAHYIDLILPVYGNLRGWHQHRFDIEAERDYQAFA